MLEDIIWPFLYEMNTHQNEGTVWILVQEENRVDCKWRWLSNSSALYFVWIVSGWWKLKERNVNGSKGNIICTLES